MTGKHPVVNRFRTRRAPNLNPVRSWNLKTADPKLSFRVVLSVEFPCYHSNIRLSAFRVVKPKTFPQEGPP